MSASKAPTRPEHAQPSGGGRGPRSGHQGGTGEKALNFLPSLKRLIKKLRPEIKAIIGVILMSAVATLLSAVGPIILGEATNIIFDAVVINHVPIAFERLAQVLLVAIVIYLIFFVLSWFAAYIVNKVVQRSMYRLRKEVAAKVENLPLSKFDHMPRGELLSRVTNDIDNISQTMQQTLSQILNNIFTVVAVVSMMFVVSWQLALVALLTIPIALFITAIIAKRAQKLFIATWKHTGELNALVEESYSGHELISLFGKQSETLSTFNKKNSDLFEASLNAQFISGIIMPVMFFIGNLNYVVIAVFGGILVTSGGLSIGSVQAFIQYSRMFTHPITHLASMANLLQSGVASAERVFEVLDFEEENNQGDQQLPTPVTGKVVFENVSFAYSPEKPLIQNMNLKVQPGQTVAIVGPTGAGKTTLVNLLMRFYDVDEGRVLVDDIDIEMISRQDLRDRMGMVLQDTWLFGGTIRDNIAYGQAGATDEEVYAASVAAYVDPFVRSLPEGYDTVINDEATNLSAGEKQLVTIARAFLSNPEILILDEATSSVDTRTEVLIQKAMARLKTGRTSFVIAHRLSTIRDADTILVMKDGNIVESGQHDVLLKNGGLFADLYRAQFAGPADSLEV